MNRLDIVRYQEEIHHLLLTADASNETSASSLIIRSQGRVYEIDPNQVSHIDFPGEVTALPGAHAWLAGAVHTKGRVVLVVDFSIFSGGPPTKNGKLIVLRGHDIAILANLEASSVEASAKFPMEAVLNEPFFIHEASASTTD